MDELDHNLLDAWDRVFEQCKADPSEARRRYERMHAGGTYDRPVRAWTVALRAADTRIDHACMVPDHGAICAQTAHEIVVDGVGLHQLGGPVRIDYPGLPIDEAAKRLGKHKEALRNWLPHKQGRTRAARAQAAKGFGYDDTTLRWQQHEPTEDRPLGVRYVPLGANSRGYRGGGMETPVVWSEWQLDPGAAKGRPPARWWGTLWESLAQKIPAEFEQVVQRVPRFVPYPDKDGKQRDRFRGWWWKCPGLIEESKAADGIRGLGDRGMDDDSLRPPMPSAALGCGRLVSTLYAPLPIWTVGRALGIEEGLEVEGLSGQWLPGVMDRWAGRRRLACEHCWKPKRVSFASYQGWNELVTYLTGGLLYGREVEQPSGFQYERRQAYAKRPRKKHRHRQAVDQPGLTGSTGVV